MPGIIVGEARDLHVQAVIAAARSQPRLVDAERLSNDPFALTSKGLSFDGERVYSDGRGWLRRIAPPCWLESASGLSIDAATATSFLSVLGAVLRAPGIRWLSAIEAVGASENKAVQYRLVEGAGCPVPDWLITTDAAVVPASGDWVAKPLGPGYFTGDRGPVSVHVQRFQQEHRGLLAGAAFLLQRLVVARAHARVVTVRRRAFAAVLDADGLPIDWRGEPASHHSFAAFSDRVLESMALEAAAACGVGFSSQDWIQDRDGGWWFVDLNPAGQWLFLPESVHARVTDSIAAWLDGEPDV